MSNWTHINCSVRGEFDTKKLEELFGKPILEWDLAHQFVYGTKKFKKQESKIFDSYRQSKLPCGEHPLSYKLIKKQRYYNKKDNISVSGCDEDVLIIWGDLRWFEMSNEEQFKQIEDIVYKILNTFEYDVRQLVMQAYEEWSGKSYVWVSAFNSKPTLHIIDKLKEELPEHRESEDEDI